jgi:ankyrin repeat protein
MAGSYDDFFIAIKNDNVSEVGELLHRGFDVNTLNAEAEHGLLLAIRTPAPRVIAMLLKREKIDVNARNRNDESPLMLAALKGQMALAQQLIDKGADINKPGWAPLHYASTSGHIELMNLLLEHHAYIDAASPNESTPLMMAAMYGTASAVKLLLEAGADPMLRNVQGLNALDFAEKGKKLDSASIIAAFMRANQVKVAAPQASSLTIEPKTIDPKTTEPVVIEPKETPPAASVILDLNAP